MKCDLLFPFITYCFCKFPCIYIRNKLFQLKPSYVNIFHSLTDNFSDIKESARCQKRYLHSYSYCWCSSSQIFRPGCSGLTTGRKKKHTFKLLTSSFVELKPEPVGAGTFWTELKPEWRSGYGSSSTLDKTEEILNDILSVLFDISLIAY